MHVFSCEWGVFVNGEAEPHPCCVGFGLCLACGDTFTIYHEVVEFLPVGVPLPIEFVKFFELDDSVCGAEFAWFEVVSDTVEDEDHVVGCAVGEFPEVSCFAFP